MGTRRSIGWLPSRAAGYLFVIAAATAVIVFVVTGAALVAAADPIVIDYSHDLVIGGAPANHYVWDVGKVEARSQWRFSSSEPVPYEIGIRSAFDPDESNAKPHASYQWEDLNKYAFRADDFFSGETTVAVPVRPRPGATRPT
ncbi:MAG: hypothetical protein O3C10_10160 [Chloroflexi bacterium]|nr:hypothetical protein [Chloroflexota bacterium]